jgi:Na+-transporting methylmalonyl-CoA/oxaloacetate decarboxylase beta subunit
MLIACGPLLELEDDIVMVSVPSKVSAERTLGANSAQIVTMGVINFMAGVIIGLPMSGAMKEPHVG